MKISKNKKKKTKKYSKEHLGHKTKEKASGELEGKFKSIFKDIHDGIVFLDKFGKILDINKRTAEIFGGPKKELIGKNFTKIGLFSVKELPALIRNFANALAGKKAYLDFSFKNKKGQQVFLECSTSILKIGGSIRILSIMKDVTVRKQMEEALQRRTQNLGERVKELNCLYELSKLFQEQGDSTEKLLQGTADLIPKSWQYPEVTCARVSFLGREFRTENFKETAWRQTSDIIVVGKRIGTVEVCYLQEKPEADEGPFLKEERELINIIAERLSRNTERKQAEEALKSSEEKFRVIFDHANDGMILADEETKKFYIGNNTICQMLGYSPEEIKKLGVADIHPKEDLPYVIEQFEKQVRREIAVAKDLPVKRKDGSIFYADVNTSLVTLAGRKYLLGLFRDITERKQAEVALRESEEKYRSLVQNIPDVVWTTDINGKTVFISPNVKKVYGYTPEEIFEGGAEVWFGRIHPDDTERLKKAYAALFKKGDLFDIEYRIKRKDGKWIWLHERAMEVYEKNGLKYTDGVFSDITERKQAEEELRKEKDKLEKYFEATGAMILFLSLDGKVLLINQNGCKTLGYEMDDILNKNWIDKFISEKDRVKGKNILDSIIREKTDTIKYSEITLLTKKREFLTVSLGSVLMKDEAGEGQAILNIGINTTELTEAKIAINQLKELNRLKDDFLNIAAHELKTPLTSIIGFSEILKGQSSSFSPEQQKQIDIINEESSRLNRIIKRMLAITRFESGREIITLEQFNLAAFIQSILPSLNVLLKDKKMKLVTDIEKNDIVIKTNKEKVLEVIYNFVDNALKYGLEEQTITISVTQLEKEWVKIAVKDQGVGIPPEKIDQLFGKFSQLEPSLTRSQEGTGMGLYICKIIIESLGGKIGVESTLGEGSVFYFILPVKKETEFPKR